MSEINITQRKVLEFLAKNPEQTFVPKEISKATKVASNHVDYALKFAYDNDYIYETIEGYMISPSGESILR